ncbi:MAG: hypothetical protein ACYSPI_08295 [Planctomycetota bacterium]|jgi:hypothetical protein
MNLFVDGRYGLRSDLTDRGITFDLRLSQFYQAVTSGGANTNAAYGGKLDYILKLDGQKLGLWEGLFVRGHRRQRRIRSNIEIWRVILMPPAKAATGYISNL